MHSLNKIPIFSVRLLSWRAFYSCSSFFPICFRLNHIFPFSLFLSPTLALSCSCFHLQPHDNNNFISADGGVSLNEDDYRYVLNDTNEYNNLIPQYLENDVNDFMFSSESQIVSNPVEYYNGGSNSNYAITNLDSTVQNYPSTNNANTFDAVLYERWVLNVRFDRSNVSTCWLIKVNQRFWHFIY